MSLSLLGFVVKNVVSFATIGGLALGLNVLLEKFHTYNHKTTDKKSKKKGDIEIDNNEIESLRQKYRQLG